MHRTDLTAENGALVVRVEVLGFLDRYPSTQLLAQRLDRDGADLSPVRRSPAPGRTVAVHTDRPLGTSVEIADVELDDEYYDRGITARRVAHSQLMDVTDILDDIEDEADALLADLLHILDDAGIEP